MNEHLHDDTAIIAAVLAGDGSRFSQIVARYSSPLLRVARSRLGSYDAADDVVQETFLCAFKSLHRYDSRFSFRTWLWTILLNQCHRDYRKRRRRPSVGSCGDLVSEQAPGFEVRVAASEEAGPAARLLAKERDERLQDVLCQLPEAQSDALRLRFFGGLKFQEIADAMGCSLSTAKNRVRCGLTRMSDMLETESVSGTTSDGPRAPRRG